MGFAEGREDVMEPFDALEAPDEEKIGTSGERGRRQVIVGEVREEGEHDIHPFAEAELGVLLGTEPAQCDEGVHVTCPTREQIAGAPELRGALVGEGAAHALATCTEFAIMAPEGVHGADEPVLVCGIELDPGAVRQDCWPTYQGHVVEVYDVEAPRQDSADVRSVYDGATELLGG